MRMRILQRQALHVLVLENNDITRRNHANHEIEGLLNRVTPQLASL
jgi:hypothetical protein